MSTRRRRENKKKGEVKRASEGKLWEGDGRRKGSVQVVDSGMAAALRLQALNVAIERSNKFGTARNLNSFQPPVRLQLSRRKPRVQAIYSPENLSASELPPASRISSSVGSPPVTSVHGIHLNLSHRHIAVLNVMACAVAVSATWLFCVAIPTLLAFKRAAESLEKLLEVTREELPDTMAALRLSGMEISDLTMELSDLGQEITSGVKRSTQAVRVAEEQLRGLANMTSKGGRKSQNHAP